MAASSDEGVIVHRGIPQRTAKIITLRDHPVKREDENSPAGAYGDFNAQDTFAGSRHFGPWFRALETQELTG
jgi:hypothetical protein